MTHGGATIRPATIDWLALADGLAHAQPRYGRDRPACGAPRIDPRFAHPIVRRCTDCIEATGVVVPGPAAR